MFETTNQMMILKIIMSTATAAAATATATATATTTTTVTIQIAISPPPPPPLLGLLAVGRSIQVEELRRQIALAKPKAPSRNRMNIAYQVLYIYIYIHVYSVWYAGFHKWGSKNGGFIMKNPSINFRGTPQFLETSMYKCVYISRSQSSRILVPKALAPSEWLDHFNVWKKKLSATLTFDHTP